MISSYRSFSEKKLYTSVHTFSAALTYTKNHHRKTRRVRNFEFLYGNSHSNRDISVVFNRLVPDFARFVSFSEFYR